MGKLLGIDLLNTRKKICSFNCAYCQLGETIQFVAGPRGFVNLERLAKGIHLVRKIKADCATFSGNWVSASRASNLGEAIELARAILDLSIAALTNSHHLFLIQRVHALK